jgi:hypothetical protein
MTVINYDFRREGIPDVNHLFLIDSCQFGIYTYGNHAVRQLNVRMNAMSLPDPITVAANAPTPALSFAVVQKDGVGATRYDAVNARSLVFTHSSPLDSGAKVERHYMKVSETKDATSPYTGGTSKQTASVSLSVSIPAFGWTATQKVALVQALLDTLADSDVTIANFLNYNS